MATFPLWMVGASVVTGPLFGAQTAPGKSGPATSFSIPIPACNVGDVRMLSVLTVANNGITFTGPTGWTLIRSDNQNPGFQFRKEFYYRVKVGGDTDANVTYTSSANCTVRYMAWSVTGPVNATPIMAATAQDYKTVITVSGVNTPGLTTTIDASLAVAFSGGEDVPPPVMTTANGFTAQGSAVTDPGGFMASLLMTKTVTPAGTSDRPIVTYTGDYTGLPKNAYLFIVQAP